MPFCIGLGRGCIDVEDFQLRILNGAASINGRTWSAVAIASGSRARVCGEPAAFILVDRGRVTAESGVVAAANTVCEKLGGGTYFAAPPKPRISSVYAYSRPSLAKPINCGGEEAYPFIPYDVRVSVSVKLSGGMVCIVPCNCFAAAPCTGEPTCVNLNPGYWTIIVDGLTPGCNYIVTSTAREWMVAVDGAAPGRCPERNTERTIEALTVALMCRSMSVRELTTVSVTPGGGGLCVYANASGPPIRVCGYMLSEGGFISTSCNCPVTGRPLARNIIIIARGGSCERLVVRWLPPTQLVATVLAVAAAAAAAAALRRG